MIRRVVSKVIGALALAFVALVLAGMLPLRPALFRLMLVADPPRRADAIVVLGGGVYDDELPGASTTMRLVHGLRLHHRGYAPVVILTGGNPAEPLYPESLVMKRVAAEVGTSPAVLVTEIAAGRTATQGEAVARLVRERGIRSILLVTSPEHSWRAARVFRKTGLEVTSTPVIAREPPALSVVIHPRHVVERVVGLVPISYEVIAIALYWWRGWL